MLVSSLPVLSGARRTRHNHSGAVEALLLRLEAEGTSSMMASQVVQAEKSCSGEHRCKGSRLVPSHARQEKYDSCTMWCLDCGEKFY